MSVNLFVYGTLMKGERDHAVLEGMKFLEEIQTAPLYTLVDIDVFAVLLEGGTTAVHGELYSGEPNQIARVHAFQQVPHRFYEGAVNLETGIACVTHYMRMEQVRGRRRLAHGSWRERFAPRSVPHRDRVFAQWARQRGAK